MIEVVPAILPKNYEDMKNKVAMVRGVVPIVQVDICDGVFVPSMTWPFLSPNQDGGISGAELDQHFRSIQNEHEGMPFWEDIDYELDLLVHDAVENFDIYTKLGPKRILFHLEAVGDLENFKNFLEGIDMYVRDTIQIGIAMNPSTPTEKFFPFSSVVDSVQIMGSDQIGYQGVELDEKVYEKVRDIRNRYPDLPISVDIGVNENTAVGLVEAGVTRLVMGSAIFNSNDIIGTIENFKNI